MNKTEQLLHMMEHPHEYTDGEWQQMLHDEECRELYTMMSKTRSAIDAARTDELIPTKPSKANGRNSAKKQRRSGKDSC